MSTKLYVGNLPDSAKDKDLRELFQAFGEVDEVAVLRGYGFVHFVKGDDAGAALSALDDSEFMGSHIQVQMARTKGHGYGRGSGPPRPRGGRGPPPSSGRYRDGYRDSYRDSYRDYRGDRRYGPYDGSRDYDRYGGGRYDDYYDRVDRYGGGGGDRYSDRYGGDYDYSRYSDYRARSRSPTRDYYSRDRGSYYDREAYRDSYSRDYSRRM